MPQPDIDERAVLGLSAGALATLSPAELPLLDVIGRELVVARPRRSDGAIGFGDAEISWIMAVVPVATVVCDLLLDVVKGAASDALKGWATDALGRLRRSPGPGTDASAASDGPPPPDGPAPPDVDELVDRIGRSAFDHGTALGLDAPRAQLLADAMRGAVAASAAAEM